MLKYAVCVCWCMHMHLPHLVWTLKSAAVSPQNKNWHKQILLFNVPVMVTVGIWQRVLGVCLVLWCRHVSVWHPGSLSQFIFVAGFFCQCTAIYCESSPPSGLSNCFGFEAGKIESTYTDRLAHYLSHAHTHTHLHTLTHFDSFGFLAECKTLRSSKAFKAQLVIKACVVHAFLSRCYTWRKKKSMPIMWLKWPRNAEPGLLALRANNLDQESKWQLYARHYHCVQP